MWKRIQRKKLKIKELAGNFFFCLREKGALAALAELYNFLKKNKYFYAGLKFFLFAPWELFKKASRRLKSRYPLSHREKRLRAVKISPKKARLQVERLVARLSKEKIEIPENAPLVSIVVLNRNGVGHLRRFLESVKKNTGYSNYEIIIIDNDSRDDSIDFLEKNEHQLPIRVIENRENVSFSAGCNQGAKEAKGELFVFMNNDLQPFHGWLDNLVSCYLRNRERAGSVGAKLIYPRKESFKLSNRLQHAGIKFEYDFRGKYFRPYNFGIGESVLNYDSEQAYPALTAALLLVPKQRFWQVGGFDESYFYGYEDVDLGLKLLKAGYENIFCPKVCAFHYEFGTQDKQKEMEVAKRRMKNANIFKKKWNSFLVKAIFEDRIQERRFYCEEGMKISVIADPRKSNYSEAMGFIEEVKKNTNWIVKKVNAKSFLKYKVGNELDLLVSFSDEYNIRKIVSESPKIVKIAWCKTGFKKWKEREFLGSYDLILAAREIEDNDSILEVIKRKSLMVESVSSEGEILKLIKGELSEQNKKPKIAIKIPTSNWDEANSWGDYHFALALEKYFKRKGWEVLIQILPDWEGNDDSDCSAVLVLRGLSFYKTKPWHFNMMWNISHPDAVSIEEYESYDHVFIASRLWAEKIREQTNNVEIEAMLQCTDSEVFRVPDEEELADVEKRSLLFVGNSRKEYRNAVKYAIENGLEVSVFGKLWEEFIDKKFIKGNYLPNEELYKHYYSADILLNDHWTDMAEKGFVSNRIFDGLASGAVLLTDYVGGIEKEMFCEYLHIYKNESDFAKKYEYIQNNKKECKKAALKAAEVVSENYTFKKRVERFIEVINGRA